jgi:hypothetical protein
VSAGVTTHCAFVEAVELEDVALDEDAVGEPSLPPQLFAKPTATTEPSREITSRRPTPATPLSLRIDSNPPLARRPERLGLFVLLPGAAQGTRQDRSHAPSSIRELGDRGLHDEARLQ